MKQALLCVSFGTSVPAARESIAAVEETLAALTPERAFRRAFTSPTIRRILEGRGERVPSLEDALDRLAAEGCADVLVQPTHLIPGIEYEKICQGVRERTARFEVLRVGRPLLEEATIPALAKILADAYPAQTGETLVLLGHGTDHPANALYGMLQAAFGAAGRGDVRIVTVEGPTADALALTGLTPSGVHLVPLMLVAGDHAQNDMAGPQPESWKSRLEAAGCTVRCTLQGLGMLSGIQTLYGQRLLEALSQ